MAEPRVVYVVIWDCMTPSPVGVFDSQADAARYCDVFRVEINAVLKRLGWTGNERVYVREALMNPLLDALLDALNAREAT